MTYTVRAPAKINLHLGVGAPREDGFHPLLHRLPGGRASATTSPSRARPAGASGSRCRTGSTPTSSRSPATTSSTGPRGCSPTTTASTRVAEVSIAKSIPVAGGMAGGSADAAAALVALDRLWGVDTSDDDLLRIAAAARQRRPVRAHRRHRARQRPRRAGRAGPRRRRPGGGWRSSSAEGLSTPAVYRHFDELNPDADPRAAGRRRPARRRSRPATCTRWRRPAQRPPAGGVRPAARPRRRHRPRGGRGRAARHGLRLRPDLRVPGRRPRRGPDVAGGVRRGRARGRAGHATARSPARTWSPT